MAKSKITSDIEKYEKQIEKLHLKIDALRKKCSHNPKYAREKFEGNQGNYDPSCDSYWVIRECLNCGERWNIDSKEDGYRSVIPFLKRTEDDEGYQVYRSKE